MVQLQLVFLYRATAARNTHFVGDRSTGLPPLVLSFDVAQHVILPLNRLCPEFADTPSSSGESLLPSGPSWPAASRTAFGRTLGPRLKPHLERLRRPIRKLAATAALLRRRPGTALPAVQDSEALDPLATPLGALLDGCIFRVPIWWARDTRGAAPPGLTDLCKELGSPCYLLPPAPLPTENDDDSAGSGEDELAIRGISELLRALQPEGPFIIAGLGDDSCGTAARIAAAMHKTGEGATLIAIRDSRGGQSSSKLVCPEVSSRVRELAELALHSGVPEETAMGLLAMVESGAEKTDSDLQALLSRLQPPGASEATWSAAVTSLLGPSTLADQPSSGCHASVDVQLAAFPGPTSSAVRAPDHSESADEWTFVPAPASESDGGCGNSLQCSETPGLMHAALLVSCLPCSSEKCLLCPCYPFRVAEAAASSFRSTPPGEPHLFHPSGRRWRASFLTPLVAPYARQPAWQIPVAPAQSPQHPRAAPACRGSTHHEERADSSRLRFSEY